MQRSSVIGNVLVADQLKILVPLDYYLTLAMKSESENLLNLHLATNYSKNLINLMYKDGNIYKSFK